MMSKLAERVIHRVSGSPFERGRQVAAASHQQRAAVLERIGAVAEGYYTEEERSWIARMWELQQRHLPQACAYVEGLASGMGIEAEQLFQSHFRYAVDDLRRAPAGAEECSSFILRGPEGLILAKNRDNPLVMRPAQSWLEQSDPAWGGRKVISVSTYGSSTAASSGMNSDGLAMTDTAVRSFDLGPGVLRYYLMDAVLYSCGSVAEAVDFVLGLPHLGGGNLFLADRTGAGAIIEIGHRSRHVEWLPAEGAGPNWIIRTNHFLSDPLRRTLCEKEGSAHFTDSSKRFAFIRAQLDSLTAPSVTAAQAILASHLETEHFAPICRHEETTGTLSGVVFEPSKGVMLQSIGTPCQREWMERRFRDDLAA